jgi:hemoglobin-like flavoprotein
LIKETWKVINYDNIKDSVSPDLNYTKLLLNRSVQNTRCLFYDSFFNYLFRIRPDLELQFPKDIGHRATLTANIIKFFFNIKSIDSVHTKISELKLLHHKFNINDDAYISVMTAILLTLNSISSVTIFQLDAWKRVMSRCIESI